MCSAEDVRKIALGFDGVREVDHYGRPAFRTATRIFAVIRPPEDKNGGLRLYLPPERKEFLFAADPTIFVRFMWGKTPELLVQMKAIGKKELAGLLSEACDAAGPKKRVSSPKNRGMR